MRFLEKIININSFHIFMQNANQSLSLSRYDVNNGKYRLCSFSKQLREKLVLGKSLDHHERHLLPIA